MQSQEFERETEAYADHIAVYGLDTYLKIKRLHFYVIGMDALGIQVVRHLMLMNPKSITVYDNQTITQEDLNPIFKIERNNIGMNRAQASIAWLQHLNPNTKLTISQKCDPKQITHNFDCVIVCNSHDIQYLIEVNNECISKKKGFIMGGCFGYSGYVFVDFGDNISFIDEAYGGFKQQTYRINQIHGKENGIISLCEECKLLDGSQIVVEGVVGMQEINGKVFPVRKKKIEEYKLNIQIGDISKYGTYVKGGIIREFKTSKKVKHKSLKQQIQNPSFTEIFGAKNQHHELHSIITSLFDQISKKKCSFEDIKEIQIGELHKNSKEKLKKMGCQCQNQEKFEKLLQNIHSTFKRKNPLASTFFGAIIAQQAFKIVGKFKPINQWFYHHFYDIFGDKSALNAEQIMILQISKIHAALTGAGCLGNELLKLFLQLGIGKTGRLTIADENKIKYSDLASQFMFTEKSINANKSEELCSSFKTIFPHYKIESIPRQICRQNKIYLTDDFWETHDIIVNASASYKSRTYVDQKCINFDKPFFQCGIQGTMGHTQIILPEKTETYSDVCDIIQEVAAIKRNAFPNKIIDIIEVARSFFFNLKELSDQWAQFYLLQKKDAINQLQITFKNRTDYYHLQSLQSIKKYCQIYESQSFEGCVILSMQVFLEEFYVKPQELLFQFPLNHVTPYGHAFWNNTRRPPTLMEIDQNDELTFSFIWQMTNIFVKMFGIKPKGSIKQILHQNKEEVFNKCKQVILKNRQLNSVTIQIEIKKIQQQILSISTKNINLPKPTVMEYQSQSPMSQSVKIISLHCFLKAKQSKMPQIYEELKPLQLQMRIAQVKPLLSTTAAVVSACLTAQIIKYVMNSPTDQHFHTSFNLSNGLMVQHNLRAPKVYEDVEFDPIMMGPLLVRPGKFTKWDKINVRGEMTLGQLITYLEEKYLFTVEGISTQSKMIHTGWNMGRTAHRLQMPIPAVLEEVQKLKQNRKFIIFQVFGRVQDEDVMMPVIRYWF